jgi:hypothetical protein
MEATRATTTAADQVEVVVKPRAIISWSSILAGALVALAALVLLSVTALAAGLEPGPLASSGEPRLGTAVSSIITGLFIVIAFGAGGLTAVWAAGVVEPGPAILHGFLVWALALLLMLTLIALGIGGLGSTATFFGSGFRPDSVDAFKRAGWATVLGLALGAGAAVLGGVLATREEISRVW